ncbi:Transcriptional regulatory protein, C terminal [Spirosomataceae bacterium TFI 002]|nr:Transcriptional regulatory protein, C terminal [Spirosomataceae bacterium TFI 002]
MSKSHLFFVCFLFLASCSPAEEHRQIVLRKIAHTLLVQSGDSTSRVMPIVKVNDSRYQLKFENEFEFVTDTLINSINNTLNNSDLPDSYMVNVLQCKSSEIVYAYEVSSKTDYLIPCSGIVNPKDCYIVQIDFMKNNNPYWVYAFTIFPLFVLFSWLFVKNKSNAEDDSSSELISIGKYFFDKTKGVLIFKNVSNKLTYQEVKLLDMLVAVPNELVSRDDLLKEIWEKEGTVVTARSLDVLVSKLRKKFLQDPTVQISNVHGKGYKLEVS